MTQEYVTIITTLGRAKIADAITNGTDLNLSDIAVGDADYSPSEGQTALQSEVYRAEANTIERETEDPSVVRMELVIPAETGGFYIREFGVFDAAGDLFAVGKMGETYKPTFEQGSGKEIIIRTRMLVSSQANVTLQIDPTVVMASRDYVDQKTASHESKTGAHDAENIAYDNTESELSATDVQAAIDETAEAANESRPPAERAHFEYYTTGAIYIGAGRYWHAGTTSQMVSWDSQLISPTMTFSPNTKYNLYLKDSAIVANGTPQITAAQLEWSTTAPTKSHAKHGWYNGNDRCIFGILTDANGYIRRFYHQGERVQYGTTIEDRAEADLDSTWVTVTLSIPDFCRRGIVTFLGNAAGDSTAIFPFVRCPGETNNGRYIAPKMVTNAVERSAKTMDVDTDSNRQIEIRFSDGGAHRMAVETDGFVFPVMM